MVRICKDAILYCVLMSFAFSVHAQSTNTTNFSKSQLDLSWKRIWEKMFVNYESLVGVSSGKEDESEFEGKIDYDEALSGAMINALEVGYDLKEEVTASVVGTWNMKPGAEEGEAFEPLDPYAKVSFTEVVEKGNFELSSDLRVGAPVSRESREGKRIVTIGSEQEVEYQFGKSPFKFEMEVYLQYNVHASDDGFDDIELRYEPAMLYSISDTSYARMAYESGMHHERHDDLILIDNREPTLQSGIGWILLKKKLDIYPFVDINLTEPSTKTALYGAQIAWAIH